MRSDTRSDCHVWQFIRRDRGFVSLGELWKAIKVLHGAVHTGRSTRMLYWHIHSINHKWYAGLDIIPKEVRKILHLGSSRDPGCWDWGSGDEHPDKRREE